MVLVYYSVILWPILLFASASDTVPWALCGASWSTSYKPDDTNTGLIPEIRPDYTLPGFNSNFSKNTINFDTNFDASPKFCHYSKPEEQNQAVNNSLQFYQKVITSEACGDPTDSYWSLMIIFLGVIAFTLVFCGSLQVRGAAWLGVVTAPMTFASFGFLAFRAISLQPNSLIDLRDRIIEESYSWEDFTSFARIEDSLINSGIISAALGQGLLQLNAAGLGVAGSWRSGIAPGKNRRSAPIWDLVWDCVVMFIFTTIGSLVCTLIVYMLIPNDMTVFNFQFDNGLNDNFLNSNFNNKTVNSSTTIPKIPASYVAQNLPGMSIAVILSLVNFIPFSKTQWSDSNTVKFYAIIITTLLLVQFAMSLLPIFNTLHTVIVQLLGAQANTCSKDGQSAEEIMAKSRPNQCLGKIFGSCGARYVARLLTAVLLATIALGICVGFPCFFGKYMVMFIRIFDDYVIPAVLATLTLAILIGIFIPICQILATHKERTSDRCVDGILPVLSIVVLCFTLLPALMAFVSSLIYLGNSRVFQMVYGYLVDNYLKDKTDQSVEPFSDVESISNENLVIFLLIVTIPATLIILLITVPCLAGCFNTCTKIRKKSQILKATSNVANNAKYHSASSTQRSQRDKYDMTSEEEAIAMNNMQHQNGMSDHLMNFADCRNNTSSSHNTALTYSSSNPELGQSCLTIFLKSLKNAFIPAREAGVSDNIIASGQSYHTLDRHGGEHHQLIPELDNDHITLQFTTTV